MSTIGIFDSGIGGLSIFREIKRLMPENNYIYFGDSANCPYGEKGQEYIIKRSVEITDMLISMGADAIVVACNTATTSAISELRARYDLPFVGIEPAIKPAVSLTKTGVVGVLATKGTLSAYAYIDKRELYESKVKFLEHIGEGFVQLVENMVFDGPEARRIIYNSICEMMEEGADTLVLGCTHYPFLKDTIQSVANECKIKDIESVTVLDPSPAIAKHLKDVLESKGLPSVETHPSVTLMSSGDETVLNKMYDRFVKHL